jgi:hypothetical protein
MKEEKEVKLKELVTPTKTFKIFKFGKEYKAPEYKLDKTNNFIKWGNDNDYPNYILELYNFYGSTTHKSIINKKVRLISGYGIRPIVDPRLSQWARENKLVKLIKKLTIDFELFNGFALEVIWSNDGSTFTLNYLPMVRLRRSIDGNMFWYSKDWKQFKKEGYEPIPMNAFDPKNRTGKQVLYFMEHNPNADQIYPIQNYSNSLNYIELDYEISKFHLNQVKQGFAPSFILNFATGIPSLEEQDEAYKDFKRNYEGAENAGKIIITYSDGGEQKPELIPIALNDSDERFIMLQDMVEKNIVLAHEIPPQLVLLTPGKLGSTDERTELLAEFQNYYVTPRQEQVEEVINDLLRLIGFSEPIKLREYKDVEINEEQDLNIQDKAQAQLKGSVGGVQGILSIQESVSKGITTIDAGAAILELIYGINKLEARRMLGEPIINTNQNEEL